MQKTLLPERIDHPLVVAVQRLAAGLDGADGQLGEHDVGPLFPVAVVGPGDQALVLQGAGNGGDLGQGQVHLPHHVLEIDLLDAAVLHVLGQQPDQGVFI